MILRKKKTKKIVRQKKSFLALLIIILLVFAGFAKGLPDPDFPVGELLTIESGTSLRQIATDLESLGFVRSGEWFLLLVRFRSPGGVVVAGDYIFDKPASAYKVVDRLSVGDYGPTQLRLTIPEGSTALQIAEIASGLIEDFDTDKFLVLASPNEGYLFPDTYQVFPSITEKELVELLVETYAEKTESVFLDAGVVDPEEQRQALIMASIIEREAFGGNYEEHRMVAGILYNRLDIGMRLQVDATLHYLLGKTSAQLTRDDLRLDSPYNTYVIYGLPPAPISNPGLLSIRATLDPAQTNYIFYLHDSSGTIRYAITHDGHVANKNLYLR